jgi:hypothetical protein
MSKTLFTSPTSECYTGQKLIIHYGSRWKRAWMWFLRVVLRRRAGCLVVADVDYTRGVITVEAQR